MQRRVFQQVRCLLKYVLRPYEDYPEILTKAGRKESGFRENKFMWLRVFTALDPSITTMLAELEKDDSAKCGYRAEPFVAPTQHHSRPCSKQ